MSTIRLRCVAAAALVRLTMLVIGCNFTQSPNRQAEDLKITTEVKTKLATDVNASSLANIEVNTTNGVVTLAGQVETAEVKSSAETVARAVPGVVRVNNNLQVDPTAAIAR